jgi:hypothetical protein
LCLACRGEGVSFLLGYDDQYDNLINVAQLGNRVEAIGELQEALVLPVDDLNAHLEVSAPLVENSLSSLWMSSGKKLTGQVQWSGRQMDNALE